MKTMALICITLLLLSYFVMARDRVQAEETFKFTTLSEWNRLYKDAEIKKGRRDLVIKAIDDGIIKMNMPLADIKILFGKDLFLSRRESPRVVQNARVNFEPIKPQPDLGEQGFYSDIGEQGWYIDMVFDSTDNLQRYSLSNLHK